MNEQSREVLTSLHGRVKSILTQNILPFWINRAFNPETKQFHGRVDRNNRPEDGAPLGVILHARLLWAFSRSAAFLSDPNYRKMADHAYRILIDRFKDREKGGLFWQVSHDGRVMKDHKQSYAQAFGIYALTEYASLSGSSEAEKEALELFNLLEQYARDPVYGGYTEALSRDWKEMDDVRLSCVDRNEKKSNNTHLHIMEAYTTLYRARKNETVREALTHSVRMMMEKIYHRQTASFILFFTQDWQTRSQTMSFGHDIEASWLLKEALDALNAAELAREYGPEVIRIADHALENYLDGHRGVMGMNNEADAGGTVDRDKIWWVQNEAAIGFLNAWSLTGISDYLRAAENIWTFCEKYMIDSAGGEWRFFARNDGVTKKNHPYKADEWKCPYHNTRACIETLERIEKILPPYYR